MKISIIIPAFNEESLIETALRCASLGKDEFARLGWKTELIVCDNNSTDRTAELACSRGARVVFEPLNQIARARNTGAAAASGDWLIFTDADSQPSAALFREVAEQIQTGNCVAGGATLRMDGDYPIANLTVRLWNRISRAARYLAGSFIFCETATFRKVGGFSNELFAGEEIDWSRRLKRLARAEGKTIVILHRHPLLTSGRKMRLYTLREHFRFLLKAIFRNRKTLTDRAACHTWYDGRR